MYRKMEMLILFCHKINLPIFMKYFNRMFPYNALLLLFIPSILFLFFVTRRIKLHVTYNIFYKLIQSRITMRLD